MCIYLCKRKLWSGDILPLHISVYIFVYLCIYVYICVYLCVYLSIYLCVYICESRKYKILAENCWWSGDILSLRLRRANQYYICTWYIHWIITSNIVTLAQRQGGQKGGVLILAPESFDPEILALQFWPEKCGHRILATGRPTKRSFAAEFQRDAGSRCSRFSNVQRFLISEQFCSK